jgi:hypothetical protein
MHHPLAHDWVHRGRRTCSGIISTRRRWQQHFFWAYTLGVAFELRLIDRLLEDWFRLYHRHLHAGDNRIREASHDNAVLGRSVLGILSQHDWIRAHRWLLCPEATIMHARVYFGLSALSSYITAALTNTEFSVGKRCGVKIPQCSN